MKWLINLLGGNIFGGIDTIIKSIFGSKYERERYAAQAEMAGQEQFAAEFQYRGKRFWFDVLVDGINRIMRPSGWFTFLGLIWLAMFNPSKAIEIFNTLTIIPEMVWIIFLTMLAFLFPSRLLEKLPIMTAMKNLRVPNTEQIQTIQEYKAEERYQSDMKDETSNLSNESILEWNRRKNEKRKLK